MGHLVKQGVHWRIAPDMDPIAHHTGLRFAPETAVNWLIVANTPDSQAIFGNKPDDSIIGKIGYSQHLRGTIAASK
jgi:hypothetical protein